MKTIATIIGLIFLVYFVQKKIKSTKPSLTITDKTEPLPYDLNSSPQKKDTDTADQNAKRLRKKNNARLLIVTSFAITISSLFLTWADIPIIEDKTGINLSLFIALIIWWHPVHATIRNRQINPFLGVTCGILSMLIAIVTPIIIMNKPFVAVGSGAFAFFIGSSLYLYAVIKHIKNQASTAKDNTKELK